MAPLGPTQTTKPLHGNQQASRPAWRLIIPSRLKQWCTTQRSRLEYSMPSEAKANVQNSKSGSRSQWSQMMDSRTFRCLWQSLCSSQMPHVPAVHLDSFSTLRRNEIQALAVFQCYWSPDFLSPWNAQCSPSLCLQTLLMKGRLAYGPQCRRLSQKWCLSSLIYLHSLSSRLFSSPPSLSLCLWTPVCSPALSAGNCQVQLCVSLK